MCLLGFLMDQSKCRDTHLNLPRGNQIPDESGTNVTSQKMSTRTFSLSLAKNPTKATLPG